MKEFYEKVREENDIYVNRTCTSHVYPAHFHINTEILVVNKGGYDITVCGRKCYVGEGDIAVIDSYDTHSYDRYTGGSDRDDMVMIVPYNLVRNLLQDESGKRISEPVIHAPGLCRELLDIADKYISTDSSPFVRSAAATLIFSRIAELAEFGDKKGRGDAALLRRILGYLQDNFKGDVTRASIANALGYTEAHISRVFHSYTGRGLKEYLNGLRLSYIDECVAKGDKRSLTELIFEAGFGSQQTYYRARKR